MKNLAHLAFKSENTLGRSLPPEIDRDFSLFDWMDPYDIDKIKLEYSKSIRRLRGKTQVISGHKNIHIRDRLIHSMEVLALSEQTGHKLCLNVPLLRAGALGHDFGHVTFGHLGETFIARQLGEHFRHEKFVIFLLEVIERDGLGLNLSRETLQVIYNHSRGSGKMTRLGVAAEDDLVMYNDKLSYIFSDYNDMIRVKLEKETVPDEMNKLGTNQTERLYSCVRGLCRESLEKGYVSFEDSKEAKQFYKVRDFMYQEVYTKIDRHELVNILERVFFYMENYFQDKRQAALALALMAEEGVYILDGLIGNYSNKFIDDKLKDTALFAVAEFMPKIPEWAELDFCNPERFLETKNFGKVPKLAFFKR